MDKPKIQLSSLVSRDQRFLSATVGDSLTMMGDDPDEVYRLDAVGKRIWDLLEKPASVSDICGVLQQEFQVEPERCQKEVVGFLAQLHEKGLIKVSEESPAG